jgi:transcriptional regulator with XRE-family HTH domain
MVRPVGVKKDDPVAIEADPLLQDGRSRPDPDPGHRYDFGVVRALRQQRGLSLEKFARACGLSPTPISRVETNLTKPNLDTLDRIADGLGLSTHSLLAMAEIREIVRHRQREHREGGFSFRSLPTAFGELLVGEGRRGAQAQSPLFHARGHVHVLLLAGSLEIRIGDRIARLGPGDGVELVALSPTHYVALEDCSFVLLAGKPARPGPADAPRPDLRLRAAGADGRRNP